MRRGAGRASLPLPDYVAVFTEVVVLDAAFVGCVFADAVNGEAAVAAQVAKRPAVEGIAVELPQVGADERFQRIGIGGVFHLVERQSKDAARKAHAWHNGCSRLMRRFFFASGRHGGV